MANAKLGRAIDDIYKLQQKLDKYEAQVTAAKKIIEAAKTKLFKRFKKSELEGGAAGKLAKAIIVERDIPSVEDFEKLCEYVKEKDAFDLLQKRVSAEAFRLRAEAGVAVPGVSVYHDVKLRVTARRSK